MELIAAFLATLLLASVAGNAIQRYRYKKQAPRRAPDLTAQELLHDLTRKGGAVLRIDVIDQSQLYLRSPRD